MQELDLSYKGFSLKLVFQRSTYYSTTEFEPGKTLYQVLFEHLMDGRTVSLGGLVRQYKKVNSDIRPRVIADLVQRIELAVELSKDRLLNRKSFRKLKQGGANPVFSRRNINSRFTPAQRDLIDQTIKLMHGEGKPKYAEIRIACLVALRKAKLGGNLAISNLALLRAKKRLGLPIQKRSSPKPPKRRL